MTNHAELSRELALALGYAPESVRIMPTSSWPGMTSPICEVYRHKVKLTGPYTNPTTWYSFDCRDPTVCLPLIKWLIREHGCDVKFTRQWDGGKKVFCVSKSGSGVYPWSDTLEIAVARAVIALKGKP